MAKKKKKEEPKTNLPSANLVESQQDMDILVKEHSKKKDPETKKVKKSSAKTKKSPTQNIQGPPDYYASTSPEIIPENYDPLEEFFAQEEDENVDFMMLDPAYYEPGKVTIYDERRHDFLGFMLGTEHYAISIMKIKEIIKHRLITPVPRAPGFLPGIMSLRGEIIPIVDLRKQLKLDVSDLSKEARILVVDFEDEKFGFLVDRVTFVSRIVEEDIEPPPGVIAGIEAKFIEGVGRIERDMLIILNVEATLRYAVEEM